MKKVNCKSTIVGILAMIYMVFVFLGLCSCQEGCLTHDQQRVFVSITGVVKRPGEYKVASIENFAELLKVAGGVGTSVHSGEPRHVHGIQILRKLDDDSSLFYLWNELTEKRFGRWRALQDKDIIIFHSGPEPSN